MSRLVSIHEDLAAADGDDEDDDDGVGGIGAGVTLLTSEH